MDNADYKPIVSFDDQSPSFVHGFEAGMIWQRMQDKEPVIEPEIPLHAENQNLLSAMSVAAGYEAEMHPCEGNLSEWMQVKFTLRPAGKSHLRIVPTHTGEET